MSEDQKAADEINQYLSRAKNTVHATCGSANGLISDTMTGLFIQIGQKMISMQIQINQKNKEIEELKKNIPQEKKK